MIHKFLKEHEEEFIRDLASLVAIDSSRGESKEDMPYGKGPAMVLQTALDLAASYGLYTENWGNYLGVVQMDSFEEKELRRLDIFAHLDVVPGGMGWEKTEPFQLYREDNLLYGRGTADDKGPALAVIYAMRYLKESGIKLNKPVRLILGCDEESGSSDLQYYFSRTKPAEMSFSPDADYPLINTEKGLYMAAFSSKMEPEKGSRILRIDCGDNGNVIPGRAHAVVQGIPIMKAVEKLKSEAKGMDLALYVRKEDGRIDITTIGKSGHASEPETTVNALTGMLQLLSALPLEENLSMKMIRQLHQWFPHQAYYGQGINLMMEDVVSGKMTACLNVLNFDGETFTGKLDCRTPLCVQKEDFMDFEANMKAEGFIMKSYFVKGHHVSEDTELVQTLLNVYEKVSGNKGGCTAIGGSTYVHGIENGVAFGCSMPDVDNRMHGADEFADLNVLLMSCEIFTQAIFDLCK